MATLVIRHGVADFATWRVAYDEAEALRTKHGCTGERVLRDPGDDELLVLHEFSDLDSAQAFANDPDLGAAMQAAGVSGPPRIEFYTDA